MSAGQMEEKLTIWTTGFMITIIWMLFGFVVLYLMFNEEMTGWIGRWQWARNVSQDIGIESCLIFLNL